MPVTTPLSVKLSMPGGLYALNAESNATRRSRLLSNSPYATFLGKTVALTGTLEDAVMRAELKSFIATVIDEELHDLDAKIGVLTAELRSVLKARAATQALRDAHAAIFPPVHTLPPEIMAKIFSLVVGDERVVLPALSAAAPWNLLTVCQYWRNIALSLPCLWSSFYIKPGPGGSALLRPPPMVHHKDRALPLEVVKHLSLSGDEPLTFAVEASEVNRSQIPLAALIEHSHRWKDVAFIGSGYDLFAALPDFGVGRLQSLQGLSIQEISQPDSRPSEFPCIRATLEKFAHARQLRRVTIETPVPQNILTDFSAITFPWAQLTYLKVSLKSPPAFGSLIYRIPGCYHLLEACPHLQTFIESYVKADPIPGPGNPFVTLPPTGISILTHQVRVLKLIQPDVLSLLQCPDLTHLSLLRPIACQASAKMFANFCRRSSCTELKNVDATFTDESSSCYITVLLALPFVETLTIKSHTCEMELYSSIIKYITVTPEAVPRLRCLKLGICDSAVWASDSESNAKLVRYLVRGVRKGAFRRVHIDITGVMSTKESDIAKLESFKSVLRNSTLSSSQLTVFNYL